MRTSCLLPLLCLPLLSQQTTTTYTKDLNGNIVPGATYSTVRSGDATTTTESTEGVNGRRVPMQSVTERVLKDDSTGRVVERIIRRFDANGHPAETEKQQIDEKKNADGSISSTATTYRSDINGNYQLAERVVTDASKSGNTTNSTITVERPTVNGSLDVVEKKVRVDDVGKNASKSDETVYRRDQGGRFVEASRVVKDTTEQDGQQVVNTAQYEPSESGRMKIASQTVARIRKNADGTESQEVDIYRNVPGRADTNATPALRERQIIEQRKVGNRVIETTSVQRPTVSDPNHLGAPRQISERICVGPNCK
ncbi:MAG: hypothetical protein IT166_10820 [Bryobacterales bacterium]|nr:hypothetical protein [Bryobacterales bacterium]